jgi:DNA-directed RNA polymerase specialized sigma24 family protein
MLLRASRPSISVDEFPNFEYTDQRPSPHAVYEERERTARVRAGLAELSHRDRTAIHLADLNDMTARQASGALGVSVPAFKSTHFRARQRLAHALRGRNELVLTAMLRHLCPTRRGRGKSLR